MEQIRLRGYTLLELAISTGIVGVGIVILLPIVSESISESHKLACAAKMRQLGAGMLAYENANGTLPRGRGFPDWSSSGDVRTGYTNYSAVRSGVHETNFLSAFVITLPFFDRQDVADLIVFNTGKRMTIGSTPINENYGAAFQAGDFFVCPADTNTTPGGVGEGNYRINFGGSTPYSGAGRDMQPRTYIDPRTGERLSPLGNGAFTFGDGIALRRFPDGLVRTAMISERTKGAALPSATYDINNFTLRPSGTWEFPLNIELFFNACENKPQTASRFDFGTAGRWPAGYDWADGWLFAGYETTQYNHVAPPNWQKVDCGGTSAISDTPAEVAISSARSMHPDCVNVVFADGHLEGISNDIDLELWRKLGARDDKVNGIKMKPTSPPGRPHR